MAKWNNKSTDELFGSIVKLKTKNEAKKFFRDLLTESELIEFGNRWKAAQMLNAHIPYSRIQKETGLSSATVARISMWLKKGVGGYKLMLNKTHHNHHSSHHPRTG